LYITEFSAGVKECGGGSQCHWPV